jgi:hypothetical protein
VINHDEATQNFVMFASFWEHIKSYIKVERYGEKEGEEYYHSAYYMALPPTVWKVYNSNTTVGGGVCG